MTAITASVVQMEIREFHWPVRGQWMLRIWREGLHCSSFAYDTYGSRDAAHDAARDVEATVVLGNASE